MNLIELNFCTNELLYTKPKLTLYASERILEFKFAVKFQT